MSHWTSRPRIGTDSRVYRHAEAHTLAWERGSLSLSLPGSSKVASLSPFLGVRLSLSLSLSLSLPPSPPPLSPSLSLSLSPPPSLSPSLSPSPSPSLPPSLPASPLTQVVLCTGVLWVPRKVGEEVVRDLEVGELRHTKQTAGEVGDLVVRGIHLSEAGEKTSVELSVVTAPEQAPVVLLHLQCHFLW